MPTGRGSQARDRTVKGRIKFPEVILVTNSRITRSVGGSGRFRLGEAGGLFTSSREVEQKSNWCNARSLSREAFFWGKTPAGRRRSHYSSCTFALIPVSAIPFARLEVQACWRRQETVQAGNYPASGDVGDTTELPGADDFRESDCELKDASPGDRPGGMAHGDGPRSMQTGY